MGKYYEPIDDAELQQILEEEMGTNKQEGVA